jgi:hypothetical protein
MKRAARLCVAVLCLAVAAGCVERRMTIISDPPGAIAIVNGHEIGPTPAEVPSNLFVYYGVYEIRLLKDGYDPLLVHQQVDPPWYEYFPLDFFSENLWPFCIRDRRVLPPYALQPTRVVPAEELLQNAASERARGQMVGVPDVGLFVPAAAPAVPHDAPPPAARLDNPLPEE